MGVARISHRKMRPCLLRDQNRHLILDPIPACRHVSGSVRANGKLPKRQRIMVEQHIVLDIFAVFLLGKEIGTSVIHDHSVCKFQPDILKLQLIQKHPCHMQNTVRGGQHRGSKHFSHRDIHIRHTVFKVCLSVRVLQLMQTDLQIRPVGAAPFDCYGHPLVQHINDLLLDPLVQLIVQCVDAHDIVEDLLILRPDIRYRKSDDRKAALLPRNVFILQHARLRGVFHGKLLLLLRQSAGRRLRLRHKRLLPEDLQHRRSAMHFRLLLILFKSASQTFQSALHKKFVQH